MSAPDLPVIVKLLRTVVEDNTDDGHANVEWANPDGPEAAEVIKELYEALEELLTARGVNPNLIAGVHPIDQHPLNAEGVAAVKAEQALSRARGEEVGNG